MRFFISGLVLAAGFLMISCGGKNAKESDNVMIKDSSSVKDSLDSLLIPEGADSTMAAFFPAVQKSLDKWISSFEGFSIDSFKLVSKSHFEQEEYREVNNMENFYELYKPALVFSPDSSMFIDLISYGITLEKKGKKIIAIGDVDQSVTLCNLQKNEWKRVVSFGPSAGMEEAVWVSPTKFVIAGTMQDDNGRLMPVILSGNAVTKSFRWFEATVYRPGGINYEPSGMKKLKIDEWE